MGIEYEYLNIVQLTELRERAEWADLLAEFKDRMGFSTANNCLIKILFSQNVSQCGGARGVYTEFYVPSYIGDADLSDLIAFMVIRACGCVPMDPWTRLAPRAAENCVDCYGATKQLAGIQKFLNELAESVSSTSQVEGVTYEFNDFDVKSIQNMPANSKYISDVYDGISPSTLKYIRATEVPYFENYYRIKITDGNSYEKHLTLNFINNAISNNIYFVRRFFNIRPSCIAPNDYFEVDVELDVYDPSVV
ncbi:MAG: hypothetical protein ACK44D_06440, partial [Bacteroidia bacterium]